jgi:hypothetical protein
MNEIINRLAEELLLEFTENRVNSFIGFVKTQKNILSKLEKDFNSGLSHCKEIIRRAKGD